MNDDFFQLDHLNKMWAKFRKETGDKPTQLIVGKKEYSDIQSWSFEYFPGNSLTTESSIEPHKRMLKDIENLHTEPFRLELIQIDKKSYLELK